MSEWVSEWVNDFDHSFLLFSAHNHSPLPVWCLPGSFFSVYCLCKILLSSQGASSPASLLTDFSSFPISYSSPSLFASPRLLHFSALPPPSLIPFLSLLLRGIRLSSAQRECLMNLKTFTSLPHSFLLSMLSTSLSPLFSFPPTTPLPASHSFTSLIY